MPPKRTSSSKRGRGARRGARASTLRRSDTEYSHPLSDIAEETRNELQRNQHSGPETTRLGSRKRSRNAFEADNDAQQSTHSTRSSGKRHQSCTGVNVTTTQVSTTSQSTVQTALVNRTTPSFATPGMLSWTSSLHSSSDTTTLALNLIDLFLSPDYWHPSLSGVIQPAACFLVASLLTRRQNLVEDVVGKLWEWGVRYEEVAEGYAVLWGMRGVFDEGVVGGYGGMVEGLPKPEEMLGPDRGEGEEGVDEEYALL